VATEHDLEQRIAHLEQRLEVERETAATRIGQLSAYQREALDGRDRIAALERELQDAARRAAMAEDAARRANDEADSLRGELAATPTEIGASLKLSRALVTLMEAA
jgi:predicted  nucleic acid-binding Zn-ribbon protein